MLSVETTTYKRKKVKLNKERPINGSLTRESLLLEQCQKH
jgi:hypothetical protein